MAGEEVEEAQALRQELSKLREQCELLGEENKELRSRVRPAPSSTSTNDVLPVVFMNINIVPASSLLSSSATSPPPRPRPPLRSNAAELHPVNILVYFTCCFKATVRRCVH